MRIALIFNPRAAGGRVQNLLPALQSEFSNHQIEVDILPTKNKAHATELVRELDLDRFDAIVTAGGDGTLFETVNGLLRNPANKKIPLGILPVGTGNAFCRDIGLLTNEWKKAISYIAGGKTRAVDVGHCRNEQTDFYFINIVGFGFVADVNALAQRMKWMGNLSYSAGVLAKTATLRSFPVLMKNDKTVFEDNATFVEISNSRYTSNFLMAPDARIDDALLDVTVLRPVSRTLLIKSFPKIFTGEHINLDVVDTFQVSQIDIETPDSMILTPDGELQGTTPISISCVPKAVEVFVASDN